MNQRNDVSGLVLLLLFVMIGAYGVYGLWDVLHYDKIVVEPGIREVAIDDHMHGRAWESTIGGQVGVFLMEDETTYWVWAGQRRHDAGPAMPSVGGKIVLATESRDEALRCAEDLKQKLSDGRRFMKTATACYFLRPLRHSEFFGTENNFIKII